MKLVTLQGQWLPYAVLGEAMQLSRFEAHAAIQRLGAAGLVFEINGPPRPIMSALRPFVLYGARYTYPPVRGVNGGPNPHKYGGVNPTRAVRD